MPAVRPKGDALAGTAGLAVWALAAAAGAAGAASRSGRILAGVPTAGEWALAAAAAAALALAAGLARGALGLGRSEEHTSELQSQSNLVCRLLLEKKNTRESQTRTVN